MMDRLDQLLFMAIVIYVYLSVRVSQPDKEDFV